MGCISLRRCLATTAQSSSTSTPSPPPQPTTSKKPKKPRLSTAVILNRSPILTRSPTPFEQAYHAYQARVWRALHQPFPYDFYFKQGSLLETRFNLEEKEREKVAFGPNFVQDDYQDPAKVEADKAAVKLLAQQEGEGQAFASREHPADKSVDVKSLDRAGERNLYLLLKSEENGKEVWRFPQGGVEGADLLHQASRAPLDSHGWTYSLNSCRLLIKTFMLSVVRTWTPGLSAEPPSVYTNHLNPTPLPHR